MKAIVRIIATEVDGVHARKLTQVRDHILLLVAEYVTFDLGDHDRCGRLGIPLLRGEVFNLTHPLVVPVDEWRHGQRQLTRECIHNFDFHAAIFSSGVPVI